MYDKQHADCHQYPPRTISSTYIYKFVERTPSITASPPKLIEIPRVQQCTKVKIEKWFNLLYDTLRTYRISRENIWNVDETSLQMVQCKMLALHPTDTPAPLLPQIPQQGNATLLCAVGSDGFPLQSHLIWPLKTTPTEFLHLSRYDVIVHCYGKGWISSSIFQKIMIEHIFPGCRRKMSLTAQKDDWALIILDGHPTRRNIAVIEFAIVHIIHILVIPPHCTYVLQPQDSVVFATLKSASQRSFVTPNPLNACSYRWAFANALPPALAAAFHTKVIRASFQKAGIDPLNKTPVLDHCRRIYPLFDQQSEEDDDTIRGMPRETAPTGGDTMCSESSTESTDPFTSGEDRSLSLR